MRDLVWSPQAQQDLIDIAAYYDGAAPDLTDQLIDRVSIAPTLLLEFPEIGSSTSSGARKWPVPKTPFLLLYDVTDKAVEIVSVAHNRSNWPR